MVSDLLLSIFYFLLNTSVIATAIGLLILLLRLIKPIPRNIIYPLWGLVFLRMSIPFTFSSETSILNFASGLIQKTIPVQTNIPIINKFVISTTNSFGFAKSYFPVVTYKTQDLTNIFTLTATIWFIVFALLCLFLAVIYIINSQEVRKSIHFKENIYLSKTAKSPFVSGIINQKIIIPESIKDNEEVLQDILLHENIHIKSFDNLKRILAILIACVHWFNPFIWIFLGSFLNDTELACDLKAIKSMKKPQRKKYAETLFVFGTGQEIQLTSGFGRSNLQLRIEHVLNFKKLTWLATLISIIFLIVTFFLLSTNPIL